MRLYSLSGDPNKPCHILKFQQTTLMLDCGLSIQTVLNFLPLSFIRSIKHDNLPTWIPRDANDPHLEGELRECFGRVFVNSIPEFMPPQHHLVDFSEIDLILISNYSCMLALPYVTQTPGFKGKVYATEPTLQIGRLYLEELASFLDVTYKAPEASKWKEYLHLLPPPLSELVKPHNWRRLYSREAVDQALSKVQMVGYNEKLDVFGAVTVTPVSSGYCLGSANWTITTNFEKIAYISGSSTLTTHPKPINQNSLKNADLLILTGLTQTPTANPDAMLGELCITVAQTVSQNGSVLIPCYPSGVVYDIFECLSSFLDTSGYTNIPMFFISPAANTSLAYSNILGEWLSTVKQNRVYTPEEPFPHAYLTRNGRLRQFPTVFAEGLSSEFRCPCVVFCGHPSLRFGDAVHFVELWANNPLNTIVFTEPDFPYTEALAPFQPLAMKVVHCPIDTSLNLTQANKLIRDLKPNALALPEMYLHPPISAPFRGDLVIDAQSFIQERTLLALKRDETLTVPLKRRHTQITMTTDMAEQLIPSEIRPGLTLSTVTAALIVRDNKHNIQTIDSFIAEGDDRTDLNGSSSSKKKSRLAEHLEKLKRPKRYTWGTLDLDELLRRIAAEGIKDAKVEHITSGCIIHLPNEDVLIQVADTSTHIFCEEDERLRSVLRNILLQCLNNF